MGWYRTVLRLEFLVTADSPEDAESYVACNLEASLKEGQLTGDDFLVGMRFETPNERDRTLIDEGIPPVVKSGFDVLNRIPGQGEVQP